MVVLPSDNLATMRYTDSGGGISKETIDQMFIPFYTTKSLNEGTGLGLSFAKEVLNFSGGDIRYSGSQQLTEFEIAFSLKSHIKEKAS